MPDGLFRVSCFYNPGIIEMNVTASRDKMPWDCGHIYIRYEMIINTKGSAVMYREKIDAYIDSKQDEMIADMAVLVNIDSQRREPKEGMPYGEGPAKALAAAEELMAKYGFATRNYGNRVVTGDFGEQEKGLDVLAHLDVVPVTEDWTMTNPFELKVVDG